MLELYIANKIYSSWSLRPWVLMRERGIAFEEKLVPFDGEKTYDAFRAFSPSAKVPCLVDGATTVWDSLAIAEYLAERHPGVWPESAGARAWARSASAEMHSGFSDLRNTCSMCLGIRVRLSANPPALQQNLSRVDEIWQDGLERHGGPFLGGQTFSAVDAFYCPVAFRIQTYGLEVSGVSAAYAKRLLALASMQAWHADALVEPWRDPEHEDHVQHCGAVLEDNRRPV